MTEESKREEIPIENIYYMLAYAFKNVKNDWFDYMIENLKNEKFEHIYDFFAHILDEGIGRQLKQGLYREYLNRKESIPSLRGRIDMPGTIRNRIARKQLLTCEYDELTENNLLNRILKTAALFLIRREEITQKYKEGLTNEMRFFSGIDTIEPALIRWNSIRFQQNNSAYRMLIGVCWLVLDGMPVTTQERGDRLSSFMIKNMPMVYEKFILNYYIEEWKGSLEVESEDLRCIGWALDDANDHLLPKMKLDVVLKHGKKILIIDAKYYSDPFQSENSTWSANLYQIFAYVKNKDAELKSKGELDTVVSGMLLYAKTITQEPLDEKYQMSGNEIRVKTLDLSRPFKEIGEQLDKVAEDYFGIKKP